ncbi:MAG: hypothetical protein LBS57_08630 [Treponema sp.]|jgi:hypothetical protein|nr:hypothetical protein [Treponema sp.]
MGEINTRRVENKIFLLGNNEYETGVLTVPANGTVPAGALLKRAAGKFAPVTDTSAVSINVADTGTKNVSVPGVPVEIPVAVNPADIENPGSSPADISFRALVGGRVRRDMLSVGGNPITDDQADMLRSYGIIPKKVTDISWVESE